jgi:hypothetical protein
MIQWLLEVCFFQVNSFRPKPRDMGLSCFLNSETNINLRKFKAFNNVQHNFRQDFLSNRCRERQDTVDLQARPLFNVPKDQEAWRN